jgi:hypothetical protein
VSARAPVREERDADPAQALGLRRALDPPLDPRREFLASADDAPVPFLRGRDWRYGFESLASASYVDRPLSRDPLVAAEFAEAVGVEPGTARPAAAPSSLVPSASAFWQSASTFVLLST